MSSNVPLSRMTVDDVCKLLRQSGYGDADPVLVEEMFARGAPRNEDGTVNFLALTAWLAREVASQ